MGLQEDILRSCADATAAESLGRRKGARKAAATQALRRQEPSRIAAYIKGFECGQKSGTARPAHAEGLNWSSIMGLLQTMMSLLRWFNLLLIPFRLVVPLLRTLKLSNLRGGLRFLRIGKFTAVGGGAMATIVAILLFLETALIPKMSAQAKQDTIVLAVIEDLDCQSAAMMTDRSGRALGLFRFNFDPACHGRPLTAPLPENVRSLISKGILHAEGETDGLFAFFGNHIIDTIHAALFNWELERKGLSRREALDQLKLGTLDTVLPWAGTSTWPTFIEARAEAGLPEGSLSSKKTNIIAAARADALLVAGDTSERARLLSEFQPVVRVRTGTGSIELGGQLAWDFLFDDRANLLGASCLFQAGWGRNWLAYVQPPEGDAATASRDRFDRNTGMARVCVNALATTSSDRDAALDYIAGWQVPHKQLPVLSAHERILITDAMPMMPTAAVTAGKLAATLDIDVQRRGAVAVEEVLAEIETVLPAGLCFNESCQTKVDYQLSLAESFDNGDFELLASWSNKHDLLLGPIYVDADGQIASHELAFGLASVHKILIALDAISMNQTDLCNRKIGDISNSSRHAPTPVEACRADGTGWVPLDNSFGRSDNLTFLDHAVKRATHIAEIELLFGLVGERGAPVQAALGTGRKAPLERFMAILASTFRGVRGQEPRVNGLKIFSGAPGRYPVDLSPLAFSDDNFATIADVFAAPVHHRRGTLSGLPAKLSELTCITAIAGKSGSPVTPDQLAFARVAIIQLECSAPGQPTRHFTVGVLIAASDQTVPIQIGYSQVNRLVRAVFAGFGPNNSFSTQNQN